MYLAIRIFSFLQKVSSQIKMYTMSSCSRMSICIAVSLMIDVGSVLKNRRLSNALRRAMSWVAAAQGKYFVLEICHVFILPLEKRRRCCSRSLAFSELGNQAL